MKLIAPAFYPDFHCIAGACRHTCCVGWEIDVDEDSCARFSAMPDIACHIEDGDPPHIALLPGERCPFLRGDGLCRMIVDHGEDCLCQICRDHPRFRSFWSDRIELGLGFVCEEACRLILGQETPLRLITLEDDGGDEELPEDEAYLLDLRDRLIAGVASSGPAARLEEYLYYRHVPDALYDGRPEARIAFVRESVRTIMDQWSMTDGSLEALAELVRAFSYDVEYDEEALEARLNALDQR